MHRRHAGALAVVAVYIALSVVAFWPLAPWDPYHLPVCNCADYGSLTAFLEWTPWAILHGHNPFYTTYQDFPSGVNLAVNTSIPVLGIAFAPFSLTLGPIAAMNVLVHVAFAGSATAMYFVLRRWTNWAPAAFVGGLLYGFSPFLFGHGRGHANLIFVPLLPVILLLADEALVRQTMRPLRVGLLLGAVAALQYGISSELLADAAVMGTIGLLLLAACHPRLIGERALHALKACGWSLVVFLPLVAYPLWMALAGPGHLSGPAHPLGALDPLRSDLLSALVPTRWQLFSLGHLGTIGSNFATGNLPENTGYVGLPLLVVLAGFVAGYRRDARLVWAAAMVAIAYLFSLGTTLNVDGHVTGFPLPFRILTQLPIFDSIVAVRFSGFVVLFGALALGIGIDHLHDSLAALRWSSLGRNRVSGYAALLVAVVALLPLMPKLPMAQRSTDPHRTSADYPVPSFFFRGGGESAIPEGSPVLVYPFSTDGLDYSVLWQAEGGERFKMMDGDATTRASDGSGNLATPPLQPALLENILTDGYYGGPNQQHGGVLPPLTTALAAIRKGLAHYRVSTVVVDPVGRRPEVVLRYITAALGHKPLFEGDVYVWFGVQADLSDLPPATPGGPQPPSKPNKPGG